MCSGVPLGGVTPNPLCRRGLLAWMLIQYFGEGGQDTLLACAPPRDPKIVPKHPQQGANWALWDPPTP